jgi:hypothetical protein
MKNWYKCTNDINKHLFDTIKNIYLYKKIVII